MLITESHKDVATKAGGDMRMPPPSTQVSAYDKG